jgi:hypothetical protein
MRVNEHQARQIQEDYMRLLDSILKRIHQRSGKEKSPAISIVYGSTAEYKSHPKEGVTKNRMDPDKVAQLQKALEDPKSLQGSLRVYVDGKLAYHNKNGEVKQDTLGLASMAKVSQEPQQAPQQQAPQTTQARLMAPLAVIPPEQRVSSMVAQKAPLTLEGLQQQIDTLKSEMTQLRQSVAEMGQRLEQFSRYEPPTPTTDPKLSNWLGSVGAAIRSTSQELSQRLGQMAQSLQSQATDKAQGLKTQVATQVQEVRQQTVTQVQQVQQQAVHRVQEVHQQAVSQVQTAHRQTVNTINQTVADLKAKAVSAAIGHILQHHGQKGPDGSLTLETASLSLKKEQDGAISVQAKDGRQVMNKGQFSATATAADIEKLDRVEKIANADLNQVQQGHAQQQGQVQPKTAGAALSR